MQKITLICEVFEGNNVETCLLSNLDEAAAAVSGGNDKLG